jgi:uncharacterized SAM-binding protein YcdF (DUF218 family)
MSVSSALLRGVGGVTLLAVIVAAFTPAPNAVVRALGARTRMERADAIVVLGSGVRAGGDLTGSSLRRMMHAVVLYRRGLAPLLVLSGPANSVGIVESHVRDELARALGIPAAAIVIADRARTTQEEARETAAMLAPRGVRRVLIVSDSLHLVRSVGVFERAGLVVFTAAIDDPSSTDDKPEARLELTRAALREVLARLYYRTARYY